MLLLFFALIRGEGASFGKVFFQFSTRFVALLTGAGLLSVAGLSTTVKIGAWSALGVIYGAPSVSVSPNGSVGAVSGSTFTTGSPTA